MEATSRHLLGADANRTHVLEWSPEGVALLLLHGFGNGAHIWDDFARAVAPYYRTIAMDQRGHGDSDWDSERRYGIHTLVRDVEAVIVALGIDRVVVVGHSLGGRVAMLFADRNPERMAGIVLVDVGPEVDARGSTRIRMEIEANPTPSFASVEEYARNLSLAYPAARPDALDRMARYDLRLREDGRYELKMDPALRQGPLRGGPEFERYRAALSPEFQWAALARIACPALVVRRAASDILSPETADKMVDKTLQNGRLAIVGQVGHSVMTDNPTASRLR